MPGRELALTGGLAHHIVPALLPFLLMDPGPLLGTVFASYMEDQR
jgi:hypothetical protein